ncbi:hypothetical protein DFP93_11320 [Aneurinibacillus soli]|uniref:Uncharacterized protein n=1 Tax=Aneurinibacillus soli TaxID=1500254 RepID=A0A0U4WEY2_9BACL|nr:hypothetical protein DFP93_11320 [Aneurinibacillus soli]BAU27288.1 hypothetical protein CB4_01457 [Aneurinibacillus soli]
MIISIYLDYGASSIMMDEDSEMVLFHIAEG